MDFYRALLGVEPAKVKPDYAKFDLADPPLVISLVPGEAGRAGNLNHAGLRVRAAEELVDIQRRLERAGMKTTREDGIECCYAEEQRLLDRRSRWRVVGGLCVPRGRRHVWHVHRSRVLPLAAVEPRECCDHSQAVKPT